MKCFFGRAIDHRIEEKRPGAKTDDRRAGDAERADIAARETRGDGCAHIAVPNYCSSNGVERIDVIGFSDDNDFARPPGPPST